MVNAVGPVQRSVIVVSADIKKGKYEAFQELMKSEAGLKTTYYLRTMGATHVEKSTMADGKLNAVDNEKEANNVCSILDPDCEACQ